MIKFAVFSKVKLTKKPTWLNKFENGNGENNWHVTLKQPCYVRCSQVADIQNKLVEINEKIKFRDGRINMTFDELVMKKEELNDVKTLMIRATSNKNIHTLQKKIVTALKDYTHYCEEESRVWEKNFKPHLTIASSLREKDYSKVKKYIPDDKICEGVINSFTLVYTKKGSGKVYTNYKFSE